MLPLLHLKVHEHLLRTWYYYHIYMLRKFVARDVSRETAKPATTNSTEQVQVYIPF